jgi:predicted transcriptional regulator
MRTVKNVLETKSKRFNTISPETLVIDALNQLSCLNVSYLIVMQGDRFKGIFTERDYSRNVILKGRTSSTTTVQDVMSTDYPIVDITDTIAYCMRLVNMHETRYLLTFDDNHKFVGIVTIHDLLKQAILDLEDQPDNNLTVQSINQNEARHFSF